MKSDRIRKSAHVRSAGCLDRRDFLAAVGVTGGVAAFPWLKAGAGESGEQMPKRKQGATVRAAFLYPPSKTFSDKWKSILG